MRSIGQQHSSLPDGNFPDRPWRFAFLSVQPSLVLFYFIFVFVCVVSRHAGLGWLPSGLPSIPPQALGGSSVGSSMHSLCQAVFLGVRVVIIRTGLYEYAWGEGRGVGPRRMQTGSHDAGKSWDAQIVLGVADCLWDEACCGSRA